ncbi:unnamed protein product [Phaeothamnion confervicola]
MPTPWRAVILLALLCPAAAWLTTNYHILKHASSPRSDTRRSTAIWRLETPRRSVCFNKQVAMAASALLRGLPDDGAGEARAEEEEEENTTPIFEQLLERCRAATQSGMAEEAERSTGSSEWSGFTTDPSLLAAAAAALERCRPRAHPDDPSGVAWPWLFLSPAPLRVPVHAERRFGIFLTVFPAGSAPPVAHRPLLGCHVLSKVLRGEVLQTKANSQRSISTTAHRADTPVWTSFGGGARRLWSGGEGGGGGREAAAILEVVFYHPRRGSDAGPEGSVGAGAAALDGYAEPREVEGQGLGREISRDAAERNAEGNDLVVPAMELPRCPVSPALLLFRDATATAADGGGDHDDEDAFEFTVVERRSGAGRISGRRRRGLPNSVELAGSVGGLGPQLDNIVRRVLGTRMISREVRQALGVTHVRGLLLHGPPGCGKTLLARELAFRLKARPPKLVSGPEILDKWVGEAERKVRALFADAEAEHARALEIGADPQELPLHVIALDEIDALCRSRGTLAGDTSGVRDSVVNQILAKMDGLVALENILVVGMTNRKELLDEALLRPGRLEVSLFVPLPDAAGREEIFGIHTRQAGAAGLLAEDVDLMALAAATDGFSGADIAGLVRSATSFAVARWQAERAVAAESSAGGDGGGGNGESSRSAASAGLPLLSGGSAGSGSAADSPPGAAAGAAAPKAAKAAAVASVVRADTSVKKGSSGGLAVTRADFEAALSEVRASTRAGRWGDGGSGGGGRLGLRRLFQKRTRRLRHASEE